jgi:acyl-CoA reductase-like NAD-dependent aldehyde dehydrogenase
MALLELATKLEHQCSSFVPKRLDVELFEKGRGKLAQLGEMVSAHKAELTLLLAAEGQRPVAMCAKEVDRAVQTILHTSNAMTELWSPLPSLNGSDPVVGAQFASPFRQTLGPVFAIVPFNFPLNLALHKVAPAIALGVPFFCKGPEQNPKLFELLEHLCKRAGVVNGVFATCTGAESEQLLATCDHPIVSFTGSLEVGLHLRSLFPRKKWILELGSTAAALVSATCFPNEADNEWEHLWNGLAQSAFGQSGQSCISLTHLFCENVEQMLSFRWAAAKFVSQSQSPDTFWGPLINRGAAEKTKQLLERAEAAGGKLWHAPLPRNAAPNEIAPTLIEVPVAWGEELTQVMRTEVFGPVVYVHICSKKEWVQRANQLNSNIHTSVYTCDREEARLWAEMLQSHAVLWNIPPHSRADVLPYGGTVFSRGNSRLHGGLVGCEGPLYAMMDFTWERLFVERNVPEPSPHLKT